LYYRGAAPLVLTVTRLCIVIYYFLFLFIVYFFIFVHTQGEQLQLLSHVAMACFSPSERLRGLASASTRERLEQAVVYLRNRCK
jgi:hypothetical protein